MSQLNDCFCYELTVFLKDINMFGGAYFSRYFEWQGMCREAYYMQVKDYEQILASGTNLITKKAWMDYALDVHVFDQILIKVQNKNIKKCSFEMIFTFLNKKTGEIIGTGGQLLTFSNAQGNITRIPQGITDVIQKHIAKD